MKKTILLLALFSCINIFSQKEANIWYFGRNAGIDFNTTPPTALTNGALNTLEGCSTFSDQNGNLLFYSDGITVWNRNHGVMRYSDGRSATDLLGNPSSTQSGMIIPRPKSSTIFYLFTVDDGPSGGGTTGQGLNLYTIDISRNSGLGEVVAGPVNLSGSLSGDWSEKVSAVRGTECDTFWVVSAVNNEFHAFKVDDTGVNTTPVISTVSRSNTRRGYLKLSPDGTKLAVANQNDIASLYNFNATNGTVDPSSQVILTNGADGEPYGVEFSVDSRKLYISTVSGFRGDLNDPATTYRLFQFDLNATNITASKTQIHRERPGFRGGLQLGPDSRIYVTIPLAFNDPRGDASSLDVIENPTANARDIIYTENAINLAGRFSTQGLPPFISSLLLPIEIIDLTSGDIINNQDRQYCIGDSIEINSGSVTGTGITYEWTFNNGTTSTVVSNQPRLLLNNINSSNNGTYTLTVNLTNDCGKITKLEGTFTIQVFEPASATPLTDINFCDIDGDGINTFDFETNLNPIVLGSLSSTQFEVLYFNNRVDAENNETRNVLTLPYTNTTPFINQNIFVRVHNKDAPNACFDITQFNLAITSLPTPTQPVDYEVCDDLTSGSDTDGINNFVLSSKDNEILGSLSATQYNVSYHTSLVDARTSATTNPIDKNSYTNTTANEQTIFVRMENRSNPSCFTVSESGTSFLPFKLVVNPLPSITNPNVTIEQCENDGNLMATVNLTQAQINISSNHTNETFKYYPTQADAIADSAEITNPVNYSANNGDVIWVRTISNKQCYRISQLSIAINFAADMIYDREFTQCDDFLDANGNDTTNNNDTDGITNFDFSAAVDEVKNLFAPAIRNDLNVLFFENVTDRDAVTNQITNINSYRNTNIPASTQQTIFIKVINRNNNNCTGLSKLFIRTLPLPNFDVTPTQILCLNNLSAIQAENPDGNYAYEWTRNNNPAVIGNAQQLNLTRGGQYEVTAINTTTLCRRSKRITVNESIIATINQNDVTVVDDSQNNMITINNAGTNLGIGNYEFALQNENNQIVVDFQDAPNFQKLSGGIYTILVRDKNNCGVAQLNVSVLEFPDFFTPNGDGINDLWNVKGASSFFYPTSSITIFDRYGKQITSLQIDGQGWNGLYNGKILPSSDYWFNIVLTDRNGRTLSRKGHFSLLRK